MAEIRAGKDFADDIPVLSNMKGEEISTPIKDLDDVKEIKDKNGVVIQSYYEIKDPPDHNNGGQNISPERNEEFEKELASYMSGGNDSRRDPPEEEKEKKWTVPGMKQAEKTGPEESEKAEDRLEREQPENYQEPERKEYREAEPPHRERQEERPVRREIPEQPDPDEEKTVFLRTGPERHDPVLKNLNTGEVYRVSCNPCTIGKSLSCDIQIPEKVISRHHAEILQYGDKWFIKDCGSTNGTFMDGLRLPKDTDVELKNNQEIIFANKKFKFHV